MSGFEVKLEGRGRSGNLLYAEGSNVAHFYFELGGAKDVLFIISGPPPHDWDATDPWARGRRKEIAYGIADEVIRQDAPRHRAEFGDDYLIQK